MLNTLKWLRLISSFIIFILMMLAAMYHQTLIYLAGQGKGQLHILLNTQTFEEYKEQAKPDSTQLENLQLIESIKKYSVDSLGFNPTTNFNTIYNQKGAPVLWVITASRAYELSAYTWHFPVVGTVTYKGFFNKQKAEVEYNRLVCLGYDAELRAVSAWSTLGWFNDPVLSTNLNRGKESLCNLLFHELFHATYYAPGQVDLNENLASFIANKATQRFLKNDTAALNTYIRNQNDEIVFNHYMLRQANSLAAFYKNVKTQPNKQLLKAARFVQITDSIKLLPLHNKKRYLARKYDILSSKNAAFVDFEQYDSLQDSIENVFNKIYRADIKKLVQDLKQNGINY